MNVKLLQEDSQRTYALVLDTGEEAVAAIEDWADSVGVTAASLTGIGAFSAATLGFFDWDTKRYLEIPVDEQVEVVSFVGDLALADERAKLHAHVVVGRRDGSTRAGHLLNGHVRPTLEVVAVESPAHLRRSTDPETGLPLLTL